MININLFALAGLSVSVVCFLLSYFIFLNAKGRLPRLWAFFNISVGIFGFGTFLVGISKTYEHAFLSWKITLFGVSYIAMFFYHVVYEFCQLNNKKLLRFVYFHGILFSILGITTNTIFHSMRYAFNQFYYYNAGIGFNVLFSIWLVIVFNAFINLFLYLKRTKGLRLIQGKYLFWGMLLGFLGGSTTSFPSWEFDIYPAWHFFICVYAAICTYAILKYQILDINVAVTRISVFVLVYSLVLGIPFGFVVLGKSWLISLFGENWFWAPMLALVVLATAGPFIYLYIQKKAEDRLLQEQRRYQMTLRQASSGMSRIKDLKKLLNLIVHIVTRTVHLEHSSIYLYDPVEKKYLLEASRSKNQLKLNGAFDHNSPFIKYLLESKEPLVYDEIKQRTQDYNDSRLAQIESHMRELDAAVVVPSFVEERLLALVVLGKKQSGKLYSGDDLAVFSILANQAALAIENAQFYEDVKRTQEQLFQAEKMATIGTMADGLSHQINNRLHALGFIAGDALDSLKLKNPVNASSEVKELVNEVQHALEKIQENVKQGGEIVQGLLKYTRKGEAGFTSVDLDQLINASIEMAQYKVKLDQIFIVKDYPEGLPKINGNFTQLQEVFFNLIDNAYDAMMQRKSEKNEENYQPKLTISAVKKEEMMQVSVLDNGMGVKEEDQDKLFTPFFTTKLSSKKGTGLGLYVIKKIIEENHKGKVQVSSEYMTGTLFTIHLPVIS